MRPGIFADRSILSVAAVPIVVAVAAVTAVPVSVLAVLYLIADQVADTGAAETANRRTGARRTNRRTHQRTSAGADRPADKRTLLARAERHPVASGQRERREQRQNPGAVPPHLPRLWPARVLFHARDCRRL